MITLELIEKRLKQLQEEREEVIANLNAYNGAITDCKYWLEEFDKQEVKKEE